MRMDEIVRVALPAYFIISFGLAFVLKSVVVARRIGKNPVVLPGEDSAYGLIGFYFKMILISLFAYVLVSALFPGIYAYFLPIQQLDHLPFRYGGLGLLALSLIWILIAQNHMRNSWRIGIDTETRTELVTTGLFARSRNPIYFGMILGLAGLFLTTPYALTALFLILGYVLMQIQIRLEEVFLTKEHGQAYLNYKQKVQRLI